MAKKEQRRAARQPQQQSRTRKPALVRPNLRRALLQGAILTAVYVVVMWLFFRSQLPVWWAAIIYVLVFFAMYTGFVYFWENFLYSRRLRRQQQGGKK
jgi:Flp pilus assembly protein TadB